VASVEEVVGEVVATGKLTAVLVSVNRVVNSVARELSGVAAFILTVWNTDAQKDDSN
jgi:hypothetical protein